jgi:anti-sigma regulatory factor (Ser/Thr protein kinase)
VAWEAPFLGGGEMSEKQFTDGGVRGARVIASVRRVRREAYFHRDNDRKLGGGIQGLECCELLWGLGAGEHVSGTAELFLGLRDQGGSQNPNPSQNEGFGAPRVLVVLEANSGAARKGWPPATRHSSLLPPCSTHSKMPVSTELKMKPIDFLQPNVNQIRHSIRDIDDSYNHTWDVLAELCQNAVDAVRQSSDGRGQIRLEIHANDKSILIVDNGIGIAPQKLPELLRPFSSDKADNEETIGEKGVGLTFVMFACNDFYIKSGNESGVGEGIVQNAYAWKTSIDSSPLLLTHNYLSEDFKGTVVRASKIENPCIFNLKAAQLIQVLRTKTALGNTRILWESDKEIDIQLKFTDQEGLVFEGAVPFRYSLPFDSLANNAKINLDEFVAWTHEADRTDHEKRAKLRDKVIFCTDAFQHTDQRTIRAISCFVPKRSTWDQLSVHAGLCTEEQVQDDKWVENFGFTRFEHGIYTSVKGMPTGISTEHPTTGYSGYWYNIFILFEDAKLKFDIGRKSIHWKQANIYKEYGKKIFNKYLQYITKYVSGEVNPTGDWDRDETFAEIDQLIDLGIPGIRLKKNPKDQEASVVALFFECIGNGKIRDLTPLCCGYRSKYDLYAMWGNKKIVIEFKSRLRNITRDFDDAQKMFDEINCIVCWDVSDEDVQALRDVGITVERIESSPISPKNPQIIPNSTHRMILSGMVQPIYVIDLKSVLS